MVVSLRASLFQQQYALYQSIICLINPFSSPAPPFPHGSALASVSYPGCRRLNKRSDSLTKNVIFFKFVVVASLYHLLCILRFLFNTAPAFDINMMNVCPGHCLVLLIIVMEHLSSNSIDAFPCCPLLLPSVSLS